MLGWLLPPVNSDPRPHSGCSISQCRPARKLHIKFKTTANVDCSSHGGWWRIKLPGPKVVSTTPEFRSSRQTLEVDR